MKTIHLHGDLRSLAPEGMQVEAETPAEVVSFLSTLPGFQPKNGVRKVVRLRGIESRDALYSKLNAPEIHVEPYFGGAGGGNGGLLQVIVGVVLIVVGALMYQFGVGPAIQKLGLSLAMGGAMMTLGGILQLLAPQPKMAGTSNKQSQYLPSDQNTVQIGTRIPLLFGRVKHGGHYLSFNVTAQEWSDQAYALPGFCNFNGDGQANRCMVS